MCQQDGLPKSQKKLWLIVLVLFMTTQWWLLHISYYNISLVVFLVGICNGLDDPWFEFLYGQENFFFFTASRPTPGSIQPSVQMGTWVFPGSSSWGMKLTTHLHPESTLGICGAVPPLPLYAFMTWTRTTLHLSLPLFLTNYFATNSNKTCTFSSSELLLMYLGRNVEIWKSEVFFPVDFFKIQNLRK